MISFFTRKRRRGQGMTEYIVIVGLIAIVLIAAIKSYSGAVEDVIVGTDGAGGITGGTTSASNDMADAIAAAEEMDDELLDDDDTN